MPLPKVVTELQRFATAFDLPEPHVTQETDGQHAFLYSSDKARRYAYSLTWNDQHPHLLWVMLNPGTGESEGRRRNTFERCKRWSQSLGYGGLIFGNVYSLRTKSAKDLLKLPDMPDSLNDKALKLLSSLTPETIVAWGNHGASSPRPGALQHLLSNPKCFGYTRANQPRHPLYVPGNASLVPWPSVIPVAYVD